MESVPGNDIGVATPGRMALAGGADPRLALEQVPRAASNRPDLVRSVIEDERDFDALETEWNALLEKSQASVFQSFEWQRTWWRHFGEGRRDARLHLVTLRAADGLVAVAPLYVESVRPLGVLGLRRLLFIGHTDSDYLDVLVERGREAECVDLIATHLAEHPGLFDMAVIEEITERSLTGPLLHEAFLRQGWTVSRFVQEQCPRTLLRRTWEETVQSFPINYRREIRRRLRNIAKAYEVELELVRSGAEVEPAMREFIEMHQDRWLRAGYWGAFADPRRAAFHCDVAGRLSRRGWLFLAFLRANRERCAANYGFSFRNEVSTFLSGARENADLWKHSPSRVLHAKSMEWAIENGSTAYDFMRGTEHYKYEFDARDIPNWTVVAYPRAPRLAAAKHRLDSASSTVRRRARREAQVLLATSRRGGGWLSTLVLKQLAHGFRRGLSDLVRVLRGGSRPEAGPE